jgi:3-methyl-2-oxobutanoate hydroxymethyltransferase
MKQKGEKIVMLTAYDYSLAQILDESEIDIILVGDSAANVVAGYETTLPITMDEMIIYTKAVSRGVKRALLIADMPFLSYQISTEEAIKNAGRFLKEAGAEGVKLEGGEQIAEIVKKLTGYGIPVMGHLGLTPQSVHQFGGYDVRAKELEEAERLMKDAKILESAGVFSIVLEKIPAKLAEEVSKSLKIPTIGIGAGVGCDGQVLVTYDMLGIFDKFQPKFVRRYAELGKIIKDAVRKFSDDVKTKTFPSDEESY